jgi:hypothetical protein
MKSEKNPEKGETFSFKYIFPTDTRELHVNGAFGGLAPDGTIRMAVYSERQAIPNFEKRFIKPDKTLGDQVGEEKKYEFVRVIQASLVFNAETARSFVNWLGDRIKESEQFKEEASKIAKRKG